MSDLLKVLGEELHTKVLEKIGDKKIGFLDGYVPLSRFNEVNEKLKTSKEQIVNYEKQSEETKKLLAQSEEYKNKYAELETTFNTTKETYEKNISNITKKTAIEKKLLEEGAKHTKLIMSDINMDNIKIDGENLLGLDDEIKKAKENYSDLFIKKENVNNETGGGSGGGSGNAETNWAEVEKKLFGE